MRRSRTRPWLAIAVNCEHYGPLRTRRDDTQSPPPRSVEACLATFVFPDRACPSSPRVTTGHIQTLTNTFSLTPDVRTAMKGIVQPQDLENGPA